MAVDVAEAPEVVDRVRVPKVSVDELLAKVERIRLKATGGEQSALDLDEK